jgi:hypothetical protein
LSLYSSEAPQGIDLSRSLFTCTNANQATTCTCNTRPRVSPHHVVNHSSQPGATIHQSSSRTPQPAPTPRHAPATPPAPRCADRTPVPLDCFNTPWTPPIKGHCQFLACAGHPAVPEPSAAPPLKRRRRAPSSAYDPAFQPPQDLPWTHRSSS